MNELIKQFEKFSMENTPPVSESGKEVASFGTRVFGGKFTDLRSGAVVKHNVHDHAAVVNVCGAFATVDIVNLEVFASVAPRMMTENVKVYLAWGHCEHSQPIDVGGLAQLPDFIIYHFSQGNLTSSMDSGLKCSFTNSISRYLKPVQLYGGRPSLYALAEAFDEDGKHLGGAVAQLFYRITVRTAGSDIVIV